MTRFRSEFPDGVELAIDVDMIRDLNADLRGSLSDVARRDISRLSEPDEEGGEGSIKHEIASHLAEQVQALAQDRLVHSQEEISYEEDQTGALRTGSIYMANKLLSFRHTFNPSVFSSSSQPAPPQPPSSQLYPDVDLGSERVGPQVLWAHAARGERRIESDLQSWYPKPLGQLFVVMDDPVGVGAKRRRLDAQS